MGRPPQDQTQSCTGPSIPQSVWTTGPLQGETQPQGMPHWTRKCARMEQPHNTTRRDRDQRVVLRRAKTIHHKIGPHSRSGPQVGTFSTYAWVPLPDGSRHHTGQLEHDRTHTIPTTWITPLHLQGKLQRITRHRTHLLHRTTRITTTTSLLRVRSCQRRESTQGHQRTRHCRRTSTHTGLLPACRSSVGL